VSVWDEAVEAAAEAVQNRIRQFPVPRKLQANPGWETGMIGWGATCPEIAQLALAAALPVVLADLAQRIEDPAETVPTFDEWTRGYAGAMSDAARIVRGYVPAEAVSR